MRSPAAIDGDHRAGIVPAASDVKNTAIPPNSYGGEALVRLADEKHLADVARADALGFRLASICASTTSDA